MLIEQSPDSAKKFFADLCAGACFMAADDIWIKTSAYDYTAVSLESGRIARFATTDPVIPLPDAKVVLGITKG